MTTSAPPAPTAPPRARPWLGNWTVLVVGVVLVALLPYVLPASRESVAVRTLIFAVMAVGWNIMSGYGGMFSFGHAAFFGIGAYADAYLLVKHGVSPWIGILVGAVLAAVFGVAVAYLSLRYRLKGAYFALATFAFAQMLLLLTSNIEALNKTRGFNVPLVPGGSWSKMQFPIGSHNYFWIVLGILAVAVAVNILLVGSRLGQYVMAIRDDETAAASLGIPIMRYQLAAVAISAAITALAGGFYTQYFLFVSPDLAFGAQVSVEAIVPAVIGGIGTIWGPVIGAAVIGRALGGHRLDPARSAVRAVLPVRPERARRRDLRRAPDPHRAVPAQGHLRIDPSEVAGMSEREGSSASGERRGPGGPSLRGPACPRSGMSLLEVEGVSKSFRGLRALDDVSLGADEDEFVGVIGPNGAGRPRCSRSSRASSRLRPGASCSTAVTSPAGRPTGWPGPGWSAPSS